MEFINARPKRGRVSLELKERVGYRSKKEGVTVKQGVTVMVRNMVTEREVPLKDSEST